MEYSNIGTTLTIIAITGMLTSLVYGLYQLLAGRQSATLAKTLTLRVSMALILLIGLILSIGLGWITPNPRSL